MLKQENLSKKYWAIIPAAGVGSRMKSDIPKQYLPLLDKTILEHSLNIFINHEKIAGIVLALSAGDPYWNNIQANYVDSPTAIQLVDGGKERCHSVLNALNFLSTQADENDWVLVHDAARPCLSKKDLDYLMSELKDHSVGGLLGLPMADTVKKCNSEHNVISTVDRSDLWRALTPQMFPLGLLTQSLNHAIYNDLMVTDEASAIELQGLKAKMLVGQAQNIKITHPDDLPLAELFLIQRYKQRNT